MFEKIAGWFAIFNPEKYWRSKTSKRFKEILPQILEIVGKDTPYIIGGQWSWMATSDLPQPLPLDAVFPELGLIQFEEEAIIYPVAIVVWPPFLGSWDVCKKYCVKSTWEYYNKAASSLRLRAEVVGWGLVEVNYWDPVDVESLTLAIKEKTLRATH